jgi:hypothetical protein
MKASNEDGGPAIASVISRCKVHSNIRLHNARHRLAVTAAIHSLEKSIHSLDNPRKEERDDTRRHDDSYPGHLATTIHINRHARWIVEVRDLGAREIAMCIRAQYPVFVLF